MSSISSLLEKNSNHHKLLLKIGKEAEAHGIPCYLVGGYVRDTLLSRKTKDIDIFHGDSTNSFPSKAAKNKYDLYYNLNVKVIFALEALLILNSASIFNINHVL